MYAIGTELRKLFPEHAPAGAMAEHAEKFGIPEGAARRYRQFATMQSKPELEDLYEKCQRLRFALNTTHFRVLIGVKHKSLRTALANKAIKQKLSINDLRRLTQQKKEPNNQPGGRKPDILKLLNPGDEKLFTERLQLDMTRWRGLLGHLLARTDDMDPRIAKSLRKLQASVENVE